jgi:hypothetical protein
MYLQNYDAINRHDFFKEVVVILKYTVLLWRSHEKL